MGYDAELNVIGALLMDNRSIDRIPHIHPEMFVDDLFSAMFAEFYKSKDRIRTYTEIDDESGEEFKCNYIDKVVLLDALQGREWQPEYIKEIIEVCQNEVLTSANIRAYGLIIYNDYRANLFRKMVNNVRGDAQTIDEDIDELMSGLETIRTVNSQDTKTLPQIVKENKDKYFKELDTPKVDTGLRQLDDILGGLEGGDLIIIGARPAVGKSAFAAQLTMHFATLGKRVGYFNLEMQEKQVYERFLCSISGINLTRLRRAIAFQADEERRFNEANDFLLSQDNIVITTCSKRVSDIRAESKAQNYDVIIVDYLQLVKSDRTYGGNRYAEVGAISHAIKALAMEMNIPVIGLCQLNRASEGREDKEPTMGELRESGDFEQDASVILLLWNTDKNDRSAKCIKVEKQRQGRTGKVKLVFDGGHMKFREEQEIREDFVDVSDDFDLVFE